MNTRSSKSVFVPPRHIKDPIHGLIPVSPKLTRFIDTTQFQRLRRVKQLGATHWVWPGASHTRFEHCLGVAYLARLTASHLQKNQPELEITARDIDCVEIAGLCHDLGHGPWSHVWDGMFIPKALSGTKWTHEVASEMMLDELIEENNVPITKRDQDFIKALIAGDPSRTPKEKAFLFEIVANKRNGLDVDKIDYIHRDSHMVGDPIHLSPVLLINSARVLDNQICYNIKDANQIYELCASRFKLHKIIYNHKTAKAIEYMVIDALLAADPYMKIAERIHDPKKYLYLTDDIMPRIQCSEELELAEARRIFNRIPKRDLYRCVDYKVIDWPNWEIFRQRITPQSIFKSVLALRTEPNTPQLENPATNWSQVSANSREVQESDIIVDFSDMHYGMKEKNPLDFVKFYSKRDINRSLPAGRDSYSTLRPQYFAEILLRVYTKNAEHIVTVQDGYRAILKQLEDEFGLKMVDPIPDEVDLEHCEPGMSANERFHEESTSGIPTSPEVEPPTTPKMNVSRLHSKNASISMKGSAGIPGTTSTPFAVNEFMTFNKPGSPSRKGKGQVSREDIRSFSSSPSPGDKRKRREEHEDEGRSKRRK